MASPSMTFANVALTSGLDNLLVSGSLTFTINLSQKFGGQVQFNASSGISGGVIAQVFRNAGPTANPVWDTVPMLQFTFAALSGPAVNQSIELPTGYYQGKFLANAGVVMTVNGVWATIDQVS